MSEEIKEIISANIGEVYKDAAQPSIRVVGNAIAQCVSLFASPIGRMANILEKNIQKYLDKLEGLKEDEIIAPDTRILVPIIEKMRYTDDEFVSDYYAEILATASKKETSKKVLISFIEILNRLSADEIKIIEYINSENNIIPINIQNDTEAEKYNLKIGNQLVSIKGGIPVVDVKLKSIKTRGFDYVQKNFNILNKRIILDSPENVYSYIDNMISLGLLERIFGENYILKAIYDELKNSEYINNFKLLENDDSKIDFSDGKIGMTDLCKKLLEVCSKNNAKQ